MSHLTIRQADPDQFDTVFSLLADGVEWLRGMGLDQWSTWEKWRDKMRPSLERGDVWLMYEDDSLVGTVTVETIGDPDFWSAGELDESAGYVSKLAIRRDRKGEELGRLLLDWARDHAFRFGCRWLRLDAWKSNDRLHAYYTARGWQYLRTADVQGRHSGTLFQIGAEPLRYTSRAMLKEIPEVPVIRSRVSVPDGPFDPAGNWRPSHFHVCDQFAVEYRSLGSRSIDIIPGYRYQLRLAQGRWKLFSSLPAAAWQEVGPLTSTSCTLDPEVQYILTHDDNEPCCIRIAEFRKNGSLATPRGMRE